MLNDDHRFIDYEERLKTFKDWPFMENCNCAPEKMAESGFYFIGTKTEPDLVRCYYCLRELDGWEPEDIPLEEHRRRHCPYIELNKSYNDLTVEDLIRLQSERDIFIIKRKVQLETEAYREEGTKMRKTMTDMVDGKKKRVRTRRKKA